MSGRSRVGGFRKGWQRIKNNWDEFKVEASIEVPPTILDLDYSKSGGVWTLNSTVQFPKTSDIGGGAPLGLSDSLLTISGTNNAWTQQTVDISAYANSTVILIFRYQNGAGFAGDIQIDDINIDGNAYSFENVTHSFETSTNNTGTYASVSWTAIAVESGNNGAWQVDQGGTPSNNTGRTDAADGTYYAYFEASAPADQAGYNGWLRSPEIALGSTPTLTFFEARNGANIGTLDIYLEVTA